jgi:methylmalonyl-CoA mutase N-terminal domain/subunit
MSQPRKSNEQLETPSGIPIDVVYRPADVPLDYAEDLADPGAFPFTRGVQATMYRGRLWTMRQYAGFGTAAETNRRFRLLLDAGQTGLSVAFDLPTQMGIDSDSPRALGEVGRVGVAIDTVDDMHRLLDGIPLDKVSTSMTINATASTLLAMYIVVGEERGIDRAKLSGTIQNDILKEYIARGTYIYPPEPSLALVAEVFRFCAKEVPNWNPISISGYHIREAGATAVQELAFTFANAVEYVRRAVASGLDVDSFAPRLSFFFAAHNDLFEEVAKFRAARRIYARLMRERFKANDQSCRLRFHTQTGGVTLQAQQPLNNVVRVAVQALSAVLGGTQSLHTNGYDEALALPTAEAATLALRTQQVIAFESGAAATVDPLAGSYYVEHLTNELERRALELLDAVDALGGLVLPGGDRAQRVRPADARRARGDGDRRGEQVRGRRVVADHSHPGFFGARARAGRAAQGIARLPRCDTRVSCSRCPARCGQISRLAAGPADRRRRPCKGERRRDRGFAAGRVGGV